MTFPLTISVSDFSLINSGTVIKKPRTSGRHSSAKSTVDAATAATTVLFFRKRANKSCTLSLRAMTVVRRAKTQLYRQNEHHNFSEFAVFNIKAK